MKNAIKAGNVIFALMPLIFSASGCTATRPNAQPQGNSVMKQGTDPIPHYISVTKSEYDANTKEARLDVKSIPESDIRDKNNEGILDSDHPDGVLNFATAHFSDKNVNRVRVRLTNTNTELFNFLVRGAPANLPQTGYAASTGKITINQYVETTGSDRIHLPPPGVTIDPNIQPLAALNASPQDKVDALRKVAESKLGVPYVWGHNEDRGQYGFDCSNFTAYVYHHALGYSFTTISRLQYSSVGVPASISEMRPGDLLAFNQGAHVGIYMGNGQMIQMGGGTAKCCYLSVAPGSYWYGRISSVKHMF